MHLGLYEIAMILGGLLLVSAGGVILWAGRRDSRGLGEDSGPGVPSSALGSLASRYLLAVVLLVWGYHLAVWAFPAHVTPVQFPRERWWVVLLGGAGAVVVSRLTDLQMRLKA